jgi:hypothetical protein
VASLLFEAPTVDDPKSVADAAVRKMEYRHLQLRWAILEQQLARDTDGTETKGIQTEFFAITQRMMAIRNLNIGMK